MGGSAKAAVNVPSATAPLPPGAYTRSTALWTRTADLSVNDDVNAQSRRPSAAFLFEPNDKLSTRRASSYQKGTWMAERIDDKTSREPLTTTGRRRGGGATSQADRRAVHGRVPARRLNISYDIAGTGHDADVGDVVHRPRHQVVRDATAITPNHGGSVGVRRASTDRAPLYDASRAGAQQEVSSAARAEPCSG